MKRLDSLILKEMFGPWAFGVAIFTVLIMAGTYLFTLTRYIVSGVSSQTIIEYTVLLLPGIMVKTFPMAVLLSTLLSFGRLSSDSEIVAIKAGGASLPRIMAPVAGFGILVALLAFFTNEKIVSYAAAKGEEIKTEIEKHINASNNTITFAIPGQAGHLKAQAMARDYNIKDQVLSDVEIATFDATGKPSSIIYAPKLEWKALPGQPLEESKWRMAEGAIVVPFDGSVLTHLGPTYPLYYQPPKPQDLLASQINDLDAFNMPQIREAITKLQADPNVSPSRVLNLWFGYYNKIALPLTAVIFGLVGAPLGIRGHRTGAASGFWLSVIIIFAYMLMADWLNVYATGQVIPPYVASFAPLAIGLVVAVVLIIRKNR